MKMKKLIYLLLPTFLLLGCTSSQISQVLDTVNSGTLTEQEVAMGLKEALEKGITVGANQASAENGFLLNQKIKIPFPQDAQRMADKLRQLGFDRQVDEFVASLNHAAEKAAEKSKPIFVDAIRSMTIQDAWGILRGDKNAATNYLRRTTTAQLTTTFQPIVLNALQQVNATKYYADLANIYNKLPGVNPVQTNLDAYATDRAIIGLFVLIEEEEREIRENPAERTTALMRRVFGSQGK